MFPLGLRALVLGAILIMTAGDSTADDRIAPLKYPEPPRSETVDDYHGRKIADPYRPLEDPDSPATRAWVEAENRVTFAFLESIPQRAAIRKRLTEPLGLREVQPAAAGGRPVLLHLQHGPAEPERPLHGRVDRRTGPGPARSQHALGRRHRRARGRLAEQGRPSPRLWHRRGRLRLERVEGPRRRDRPGPARPRQVGQVLGRRVAAGRPRASITAGSPSPSPGEDLKGANYNQKVYLPPPRDAPGRRPPRLGGPRAQGVAGRPQGHRRRQVPDPDRREGHRRQVSRALPAARPARSRSPSHLVGEFEAEYTFIDNDGPVFWFKTNKDAPRGKVVAIDIRNPAPEHWVELIPQAAGDARARRPRSAASSWPSISKDAHTVVRVFDLEGRHVRDVEFPGLGTATGFGGKRTDQETFYSFTSFTTPVDDLPLRRGDGQEHGLASARSSQFDPGDYETTQVFYQSKDGTRIPMFLSHKKGLKRDGRDADPALRLRRLQHLAHAELQPVASWPGWRWAASTPLPNLRGGGEYGEEWHQAGTKLKKQNVFDDFIAAAEWLIAERYTSTPKLAIAGGSNGGLLVGACLTQRPDLFGAALPAVGVMDMLRFHKFTIGWAWVDDYGSSDDPEQFQRPGRVQPAAQHQAGHMLSADADHHGRPRRPRRPGPQLQVRRGAPGGAVVRQPGPDPHRDQGRPRRRQADDQADRGGRRPVGVPGQGAEDRSGARGEVRSIHHFEGPAADIPASNRDHGPHFISLISPRIHSYSG